jgi:hypothetical protein
MSVTSPDFVPETTEAFNASLAAELESIQAKREKADKTVLGTAPESAVTKAEEDSKSAEVGVDAEKSTELDLSKESIDEADDVIDRMREKISEELHEFIEEFLDDSTMPQGERHWFALGKIGSYLFRAMMIKLHAGGIAKNLGSDFADSVAMNFEVAVTAIKSGEWSMFTN